MMTDEALHELCEFIFDSPPEAHREPRQRCVRCWTHLARYHVGARALCASCLTPEEKEAIDAGIRIANEEKLSPLNVEGGMGL